MYVNTASWNTKTKSIEALKFPSEPCLKVIGGDWNFIERKEDTVSFSSHYELPPFFKTAWDHFSETTQAKEVTFDSYTHYRFNKQLDKTSAARLDRFYLSCPEAFLASFHPTAHLARPGIALKVNPATNHEPIIFSCHSVDGLRSPFRRIPQWIAKTDRFATYFKEYLKRNAPIDSLELFHQIAHATAQVTKKYIKATTTQLVEDTVAKIKAIKVITLNPFDRKKIENLIKKCPDLANFFPDPLPEELTCSKLVREVEKTLNLHADPWSDSLKSWTQSPGPQTNFIKQAKLFLPSTRKRISVLLIDGEPTSDPVRMGKAASEFWGGLWTERDIDDKVIESFLESYPCTFTTPIQFPTLKEAQDLVRRSKNSSAGPKGIPFLVYRCAPEIAGELILQDLKVLSTEDGLPCEDYNHSLLYLIPKKMSGLTPDTRPIQVPNTANRLTSSLVKEAIHKQVAETVSKNQKAFVKGRRILEHVHDIASTYYASLSKKQQAFILLLDFKKAYDSVSHKFLLAVLEKIGLPDWVKNAVRNLLRDQVTHLTRPFQGPPIPIGRGVKQGCPLSPLLFILVIDTLVRRLERLPITSKAFADDIGIVFGDIESLRDIQTQVDLYCVASGAAINQSKTVLIPSTPITAALRNWVRSTRWPKVKVKKRGLYLGVCVGLDVNTTTVFDTAIAKLVDRFKDYRPFRPVFSVPKRLKIARTFLLPLLSYLYSLYVIPSGHLVTIKRQLREWVVPFNSLKLTTLAIPSRFFGLQSHIPPISFVNAAAILAQQPDVLTTDLGEEKIDTNNPHPMHSKQAALDFFFTRHPSWEGGTTQKENTTILVNSPTHLREHFGNIRTALKRWCKRLKSWTTTTLLPLPEYREKEPPEPDRPTMSDRVKRKYNQVVLGKRVIPRNTVKQGSTPIELEIPSQEFPQGEHELLLWTPNLLNNWQLIDKELTDSIRITTIQLVFNALATSNRVRHFTEEKPCPLCGGKDTAFHFFQLCQPTQQVIQGLTTLAALYFGLHPPGTRPPPDPIVTPEPLFYNKLPFGDRLLAFPPNRNRALFAVYTTFALWIGRQKTIQLSFSNQEFATQVNQIFVSLLRKEHKMGVKPEVKKLFSRKTRISPSCREEVKEEPEDQPPPPARKKAGLSTPKSHFVLQASDLRKNWFLALKGPEGKTWVGKIRKTELVDGGVEVHTYDTLSNKQQFELSQWFWRPCYEDPGDEGKIGIGKPATTLEKFSWKPWRWWPPLSAAFLPPFRLKKGKIPEDLFRSDRVVDRLPQELPPQPGPSLTSDNLRDEGEALPDPKEHTPIAPPDLVHIYTDGSCLGNPGPCGAGVFACFPEGKYQEKTEVRLSFALGKRGTNNIGELYAIGAAMDLLNTPRYAPRITPDMDIVLHTDSDYSIGVLTKGWNTKENQELIKQVLWKLNNRYTTNKIHFHWVKGHAGIRGNEEADRLANVGSANSAKGKKIRPWLDPLSL